jgi:hypothetical protein
MIISQLKYDISLNTISKNYKNSEIKIQTSNNVIKGEIQGYFDYLGIIYLRVVPTEALLFSNSKVIFKIREKSQHKWFHINEYKASYLYYNPFFPFGFPEIINSKNRTFEFEISMKDKSEDENLLIIQKKQPLIKTIHLYPIKVLLSNPDLLFRFIFKKLFIDINLNYVLNRAIFFYMPFILYITWLILPGKSFFKKKLVFVKKFIVTSIINRFIFNTLITYIMLTLIIPNKILMLVGILLYCFCIHKKQVNIISTLILCIFLILFSFILLSVNIIAVSDRAMEWAQLLFTLNLFSLIFFKNGENSKKT